MSLDEIPAQYRDFVKHGLARYRKGCRCDQCCQSKLDASRQAKDKHRLESIRGIPREDLFQCFLCGRLFPTKRGATVHESTCEL